MQSTGERERQKTDTDFFSFVHYTVLWQRGQLPIEYQTIVIVSLCVCVCVCVRARVDHAWFHFGFIHSNLVHMNVMFRKNENACDEYE